MSEERHDAYGALRSANYRRFALGFVLSSTALQMLSMTIGYEVYERTNDKLALGYIGLARAAPVILLSLPGGQVADLLDRRRIVVVTQMVFALCAVGLAVASKLSAPLWVFYVLLALTGCTRSFNGPARNSLLPQIVEPDLFHNAVTWNSGLFQFAAVSGPLLAGAMLDHWHAPWMVYAAVAAGCGAFSLSTATIRAPAPVRAEGARPRLTLGALTAGIGHLRREKTILAAITLDLFAVLLGGATALLPVYAKDILKVGATELGALRASLFVGALLMSLWLAHRPPFRRAGSALLWSVAGFGAATIVFGLSTNFWLSLSMLALAGALDNISVVIRHVLVQLRTPEALRGRVGAVNTLFIESSNELGAFESGLVAKLFGPVVSVVSGGIGTIVVVLGVAWAWREIRELRAITPTSQTEGGAS